MTEEMNENGICEDSEIKLKIISAKDLTCEDWDGSADCYVIVTYDDFETRTDIISDTEVPVWNASFSWRVVKPGTIDMALWDHNPIRPHTMIGTCEINTDVLKD